MDASVFYYEIVLATSKRNALINYFRHFDVYVEDQYQFAAEKKRTNRFNIKNMNKEQESELKKIIEKIINNNPKTFERYKNGQKGLIGFFVKNTMKKSTISFFSKDSRQNLAFLTKKELNQTEIHTE